MITLARLKKPVARVALAFLPATLTVMLARMDTAPLPESLEGSIHVTVPELSAVRILDVCEGDFRVSGTAETTQERPLLPDGHPSVWVMVPGRITAGVDMSEMEVCWHGNGLQVELPWPEITSVVPRYGDIQWGHHADLWTEDPDGAVLSLRESLFAHAGNSLEDEAVVSGLLEEAIKNVQTAVLQIASALDIDQISVCTAPGRVVPLGFTD